MGGGRGIDRRSFLRNAGLLGLGCLTGCPYVTDLGISPYQKKEKRPNFVLIVADDLGYADIGAPDIPTPNIDSIAANGVTFTNGYVSCPVCSPTRAGLMTGRYQQRFGHEFNGGPPRTASEKFGLPLTEMTMPQRLKSMGYVTGMSGKWHLGFRPEYHPLQRGFDEFYGFLGGMHDYFRIEDPRTGFILRGTEPVTELTYTTEDFAREAAAFIERHHSEPFFLYLAFNAVHMPRQAPAQYLERFSNIADERRRYCAAQLSAMDDGIGLVLARLSQYGIADNTMIFFISDNGGPTPTNGSRNDPLRGYKGSVLEGGIRVPFLMQWNGKIPRGRIENRPVISLDILPTMLAATRTEMKTEQPLDGVDLLPYLKHKRRKLPHEALFWRYGEQWAARMDGWKLISMNSDPTQLYNLRHDIGERENLAALYPDKVDEIKAAYEAWNAKNVAPLWQKA
jgi:arylsulfatase A-like enzyme